MYSHVCSLLCTPGWAQTAVSSYLLSLPPALPRTFLYSELSPGSFPLEQLCAALGARDRLRSFPSSILWQCLTLPTTQSSKCLNSSPLHTSSTEATQAFLPRGLHSHAPPSRALCPSLTPCFLNPRHKDFFSSYFCDFFFSTNPEIRNIERGVRLNKQFSEHPGNGHCGFERHKQPGQLCHMAADVYAGSSSSIAASLLVLLLCSSSGPAGRMLVTVCRRASICSSVSRSSLSSTISWISTAVIGL